MWSISSHWDFDHSESQTCQQDRATQHPLGSTCMLANQWQSFTFHIRMTSDKKEVASSQINHWKYSEIWAGLGGWWCFSLFAVSWGTQHPQSLCPVLTCRQVCVYLGVALGISGGDPVSPGVSLLSTPVSRWFSWSTALPWPVLGGGTWIGTTWSVGLTLVCLTIISTPNFLLYFFSDRTYSPTLSSTAYTLNTLLTLADSQGTEKVTTQLHGWKHDVLFVCLWSCAGAFDSWWQGSCL